MTDEKPKCTLKNLDIPAPSEEARQRVMQAAMQAFEQEQEKAAKGFTETIRPIHKDSLFTLWKRNLTMKKAYVFAGSFAAVAVVLAITTTHYSTIMEPVKIAPPPEKVVAGPVETSKPEKKDLDAVLKAVEGTSQDKEADISAAEPELSVGADDAEQKVEAMAENAPASIINNAAPGMQGYAGMAAPVSPPAPPVVMSESYRGDALAKRRHSLGAAQPQMTQESAASSSIAGGVVAYDMAMPQPMPPYYGGGDRFEERAVNAAKSTAQEPVSTFSIDVDTASYSFVRRMLNQGQLPQPNMVRVEEMINYFPYNYELPQERSEPFKPVVTMFQSPWNAEKKLVHIGIKGYDLTHIKRPAANLVFLIDVSGSMNAPDKLPLVKSSLHMLVDQMDEGDTISIVTYAGHAGTALTPTSGADKQRIRSVIDVLGAGGSTAGAAGIEEAYKLASQHFNKGGVNRVILATDGDFNVGINNVTHLKSFIEQKRQTGIFLSVLGFGQGNYNDALMQSIAQHGNGNAAYIDNINEARKVLVDEMSSTLFTIAKDVKIQVEWNPAEVAEYRLVGYESRLLNREDFNNDKVDAGDVGAGHSVTAIYEITPKGAKGTVDPLRYGVQPAPEQDIKPSAAFAGEYGFLKIRYKLPDASESKLMTLPVAANQEVASIEQASAEVRFAAAVAEFGQLLKRDPAVAGGGFDHVIALADGARGSDPHGLRAEFINLVRTAKALQGAAGYPLPEPQPVPLPAPGVMR